MTERKGKSKSKGKGNCNGNGNGNYNGNGNGNGNGLEARWALFIPPFAKCAKDGAPGRFWLV